MEFTTLWPSGPRVSRVAFGCAAIGGYDYGPVDDQTSVAAIHRALELGVNFFDVADVYGLGHAETILGRAIRSAAARGEAIVATKGGVRWDARGRTRRDLSPLWIADAVDGSLRRLGVSVIDLYQLHWPDPATPLDDTLEALVRLQAQGKIRQIGVCNFGVADLAAAQRCTRIVGHQLPYSVADQSRHAVIEAAWTSTGTPTLAYNVLAHGLLSGRGREPDSFAATDLRRRPDVVPGDWRQLCMRLSEQLAALGASHEKTAAQVAIRWVLEQPGVAVALTGVKRPEQIEENVGGCDWALPSAERHALGTTEQVTRLPRPVSHEEI